jgi:hypothetical protein
MADATFDPKDNIIALLGLEDLPDEDKISMVERMSDLVQKRTILRVMEALSDDDAKAAEAIADEPERLMAFLGTKADMGAILSQEVDRLKNELLIASEDVSIAE